MTGTASQLLNIVLRFVCRTVFIKTLGVSYLGINGLFSDILSLLALAELGIDMAINYRLYKPIAEKNDDEVRKYLYFFRSAYWYIGGFIAIVGVLFLPLLKFIIADYDSLGALGINASLIFILYLFQNVSTYLFGAYRGIVLKAAQKQYILDIAVFALHFLSSIVQILVLIFLHDFICYVLVIIIFGVTGNVVSAILATKTFPQYFKYGNVKLCREEKVSIIKDCSALFVYKINNVVMKATDNIVLSSFIGLTIVGLYSNYLMVFTAINGILNTVFSGLKASLGNLFVKGDAKKNYFMFEVMSFITTTLYGIAAIGIAVEINEMIELWIGKEYIIPQPFPILIGIEMLFTGLKLNLAQIRHITGIFTQMWYRPVIGSIINIVFSIVFVHIWGISGVILGTLMAAIFANLAIDPKIIHKYSFKNYISVWHYYKKNCLFICLLTIICIVNFFLCSHLYVGHGLWSLLFHCLIIIISTISTIAIIYWKQEEMTYLKVRVHEAIKGRQKSNIL